TSRYVKPGETVLDLGRGAGKICFIASQLVGPAGRVIGVDMTDEMLQVARRNAPVVAERLGYANVEFRKGRIQDLALDLEILEAELEKHPIANANTFLRAQELAADLRIEHPLVETECVDVAVANGGGHRVPLRYSRSLQGQTRRLLGIEPGRDLSRAVPRSARR